MDNASNREVHHELSVDEMSTLLQTGLYALFSDNPTMQEVYFFGGGEEDGNGKEEEFHGNALLQETRIEINFCNRLEEIYRLFMPEFSAEIVKSLEVGKISGGVSKGKSKSFVFSSKDKKFIFKSITEKEFGILDAVLDDYAKYLVQFPHSVLPRIFGCCTIYSVSGEHESTPLLKFLIFNNVFASAAEQGKEIHKIYDLKGSQVNRSTAIDKRESKSTVLKDMDFREDQDSLRMDRNTMLILKLQLTQDARFLESLGIMDYSLLVGIHFLSDEEKAKTLGAQNVRKVTPIRKGDQEYADFITMIKNQSKESVDDDDQPSGDSEVKSEEDQVGHFEGMFHLGIQSKTSRGVDLFEVYYIGIIDVLQRYDIQKVMESAVKRTVYEKDKISSINPHEYANRFIGFIEEIIK